MEIRFEVKHLDKFQRNIRDIGVKYRKAAAPIVREAAKLVRREQQRLLVSLIAANPNNESTGTLKKAIKYVTVRESKSGKDRVEVLIGIVRKSGPILAPNITKKGTKPYYWIFFEKGFHRGGTLVPGKEFVAPSARNQKAGIESALTAGVNKHLRQYERS
jgi:hypothetical protein